MGSPDIDHQRAENRFSLPGALAGDLQLLLATNQFQILRHGDAERTTVQTYYYGQGQLPPHYLLRMRVYDGAVDPTGQTITIPSPDQTAWLEVKSDPDAYEIVKGREQIPAGIMSEIMADPSSMQRVMEARRRVPMDTPSSILTPADINAFLRPDNIDPEVPLHILFATQVFRTHHVLDGMRLTVDQQQRVFGFGPGVETGQCFYTADHLRLELKAPQVSRAAMQISQRLQKIGAEVSDSGRDDIERQYQAFVTGRFSASGA